MHQEVYQIFQQGLAIAKQEKILQEYLIYFKRQNVLKKRKLSNVAHVDKAKNTGKKK